MRQRRRRCSGRGPDGIEVDQGGQQDGLQAVHVQSAGHVPVADRPASLAGQRRTPQDHVGDRRGGRAVAGAVGQEGCGWGLHRALSKLYRRRRPPRCRWR